MGHLTGARVSALLDGHLSAAEAEQAWAHVHACHRCRDRVEREGWIKARLAGLSEDEGAAPEHLRGSLHRLTPGERFLVDPHASARELAGAAPVGHGRRAAAMVGGGAAGAAMLGVLALGMAPASTPTDRRPTSGDTPSVSTTVTPPGHVAVAVTEPAGPPVTTPTTATTTGSTSPSATTSP